MGYTKQLYGSFYQNSNSANCVSGGTFGISGADTNLTWSDNKINLPGGHKYFLETNWINTNFDAVTNRATAQFYNETAGEYIGCQGMAQPFTSTNWESADPYCYAYFAPTEDSEVSIKWVGASGSPQQSAVYTKIYVRSIPDNMPGYQWCALNMSGDQTGSPIAIDSKIAFEKVAGTLDVSSNEITLVAGNTYLLRCKFGRQMTTANDYGDISWYREDTGAYIGTQSLQRGLNSATQVPCTGEAFAVITPDSNINVSARLKDGDPVTKVLADRSYAWVEKIDRLGTKDKKWSITGLQTNQDNPNSGDRVNLIDEGGNISFNDTTHIATLPGGRLYYMRANAHMSTNNDTDFNTMGLYNETTSSFLSGPVRAFLIPVTFTTANSCSCNTNATWITPPTDSYEMSWKLWTEKSCFRLWATVCNKMFIMSLD